MLTEIERRTLGQFPNSSQQPGCDLFALFIDTLLDTLPHCLLHRFLNFFPLQRVFNRDRDRKEGTERGG